MANKLPKKVMKRGTYSDAGVSDKASDEPTEAESREDMEFQDEEEADKEEY